MIALLAIGLITEPLDGGIKKDHATLSYYFTTSAMAIMVIVVALIAERRYGVRLRALEACGANPMFAYTASGYLLTPLLTLTSLSVLVDKFANLGPWVRSVAECCLRCLSSQLHIRSHVETIIGNPKNNR